MIVFDTESWDAADRVERWREEFGRSVVRAEVLADRDNAADFSVRMAMLGGPSLAMLTMRMRAIRKIRDRTWLGDGADDLTLMLCLSGTVRFDTNGARRFLRRGEAALFSHIVPVALHWEEARIATVQIPRAALAAAGDLDHLAGQIMGRGNPARAMLQVYLAELWRQHEPLTPRAERHILDLIVEGLTGNGPPQDGVDRIGGARLPAIRAIIRDHAGGDLRIKDVGARLGVTVRTVERALASCGTTFSDELINARLNATLARLGGTARISDIAYDAGFGDLSSFNRRFKARFGHTPSEQRQLLRRPEGAG